ncbi:unnamed protein product [Vitrella brassicaformis CCMP3155]|uniref:Uncharacterized protein n=1 Tax=Vitrella brassicaformis (strain CCMP3155) TaxID=1169540 RepID=A0A0G4FHX6_VITBC|nr:unnamed protein product [Vitrella brassicaformis CCMP3155]|eukprot:CEM12698.1 unnamed protein product [Vitrella brassicaformis CCMP3155]
MFFSTQGRLRLLYGAARKRQQGLTTSISEGNLPRVSAFEAQKVIRDWAKLTDYPTLFVSPVKTRTARNRAADFTIYKQATSDVRDLTEQFRPFAQKDLTETLNVRA